MTSVNLYPELASKVAELERVLPLIPLYRQRRLAELSEYIVRWYGLPLSLNFICTHNSRRSHIAMIWAAVAAAHYGVENIHTFSGGTEATAFNPRAIAALRRVGFRIDAAEGDNPRFLVRFAESEPPLVCFSKVYNHRDNPRKDFVAIMTCSDADDNCPLIPGDRMRLVLKYKDPKSADDTPHEAQLYDERVAQIGREMLFVFSLVEKMRSGQRFDFSPRMI